MNYLHGRAAKKCGVSCKIVVPGFAAQYRIDLIMAQGAAVVKCDHASPEGV